MPGIGEAVFEALTTHSGLSLIVGDRVYPADGVDEVAVTTDDGVLSYAEYVVTREDEDRALEGTLLGYDSEVTVTFITPTYSQGQFALLQGRMALNAMKGQTLVGKVIDAAQVTDGSDTPSGPVERDEQQVFQADLTVGILYRE